MQIDGVDVSGVLDDGGGHKKGSARLRKMSARVAEVMVDEGTRKRVSGTTCIIDLSLLKLVEAALYAMQTAARSSRQVILEACGGVNSTCGMHLMLDFMLAEGIFRLRSAYICAICCNR